MEEMFLSIYFWIATASLAIASGTILLAVALTNLTWCVEGEYEQ